MKVAAEQSYDYQLLMEYHAKLASLKVADPTFYGLYERVKSCTMVQSRNYTPCTQPFSTF